MHGISDMIDWIIQLISTIVDAKECLEISYYFSYKNRYKNTLWMVSLQNDIKFQFNKYRKSKLINVSFLLVGIKNTYPKFH